MLKTEPRVIASVKNCSAPQVIYQHKDTEPEKSNLFLPLRLFLPL